MSEERKLIDLNALFRRQTLLYTDDETGKEYKGSYLGNYDWPGFSGTQHEMDMIGAFIEILENEPAADPYEHGHWVPYEPKYPEAFEGKAWVCSKCNQIMYSAFLFKRQIADFCPYCGAKMDGGEKNGDA